LSHELKGSGWFAAPNNAFEAGLPPHDLTVLLYLYRRANGDAQSWPGVQRIAKDTRMSDRQVQLSLRNLKDAGFLHVESRVDAHGSPTSNLYTLVNMNTVHLVNDVHQGGECGSPPLVKVLHPKDTKLEGLPIKESGKPKKRDNVLGLMELLPEPLRTPEVETAWSEFVEHRKEKHKTPYTERGLKGQAKFLSGFDAATIVAMIDKSIRNGYDGIHEIHSGNSVGTSAIRTALNNLSQDTSGLTAIFARAFLVWVEMDLIGRPKSMQATTVSDLESNIGAMIQAWSNAAINSDLLPVDIESAIVKISRAPKFFPCYADLSAETIKCAEERRRAAISVDSQAAADDVPMDREVAREEMKSVMAKWKERQIEIDHAKSAIQSLNSSEKKQHLGLATVGENQ
jgi:hypothetical protein